MRIIKIKRTVQTSGRQTAGYSGNKHMIKTVTWRIIILSLTFCFFIAPGAIYMTLRVTSVVSWYLVVGDTTIIIMFLNNGVNFFLYYMIGSEFRRDLILICKFRSQRGSSVVGTIASHLSDRGSIPVSGRM